MIGFGTESDFQEEKNCDLPEVGFRGKPTFQKEKNRYLKKSTLIKIFGASFLFEIFVPILLIIRPGKIFIKNSTLFFNEMVIRPTSKRP